MANDNEPVDGLPVRKINGPLGDIWKRMNKANQLPHDRQHDTLGIEEHVEFEQGAWIDMCQYIGLAAHEGQVNGGLDLSSLPINTEQISTGYYSSGTIDKDLLLLIKSSKYVDDEIVATFHDPLGYIDGYFHRDVVEAIGAVLVKDTGIILRNVTVFMPVERRQQYLNICRGNVVAIFPTNSNYADDVKAFNDQQMEWLETSNILEDPSGVATTSADLLVMTQRHVIHQSHAQRAPPPVHHRGKQKWAWKSFAPKDKRKKKQEESPKTSDNSSPAPPPKAKTKAKKPPAQAPALPTPSIPSSTPKSTKRVQILPTPAMPPDQVSQALEEVLNEDDW